jgi:hypothetical protein
VSYSLSHFPNFSFDKEHNSNLEMRIQRGTDERRPNRTGRCRSQEIGSD